MVFVDILRWCIPSKEIGVGLNVIFVGDYSCGGGFLCYPSIETMKPRYDNAMNTRSDLAKDVTGDFEKFKDFARQVLSVPHSEIKEKLDAERVAKRTPKGHASRVSVARSKPA